MQLGYRYLGSSSLQTSTANQELVPDKTVFYKFSFMNNEDCTVQINGSEPIFLRANQGFSMNEVDAFINSFIIVESGIQYNWLGGQK